MTIYEMIDAAKGQLTCPFCEEKGAIQIEECPLGLYFSCSDGDGGCGVTVVVEGMTKELCLKHYVAITTEIENIRDKAWMYDDLCK